MRKAAPKIITTLMQWSATTHARCDDCRFAVKIMGQNYVFCPCRVHVGMCNLLRHVPSNYVSMWMHKLYPVDTDRGTRANYSKWNVFDIFWFNRTLKWWLCWELKFYYYKYNLSHKSSTQMIEINVMISCD